MEPVRYSEFSLGVHNRVAGRRIPLSATIEVTRRCPLACVHCYNNLALGDQGALLKELTCAEHCRILDEITEAGCFWLLYTGGEIFARKDFLEIYTYAKQKGLLISLFTNGTFITPKIADYLSEWRPFSIEITLYGRTRATYERVTGVSGSYAKCMRGIELLVERGLPLSLKTMVITTNQEELWSMKDYVEKDLGLEFRFDALINPRIDCAQNPLGVRLSPREVVELDRKDPKRMAEWGRFCEKFHGPVHAPGQMDELYHCGGGTNSFAIDPQGMLRVCALSCHAAYDLRTGSFRDGWEGFLSNVRQQKTTRQTKCTSCEIMALCGMCPANAQLENKDAEEPVDFLCQVAHLRADALGLQLKQHGECEYCKSDQPAEC